MPTSTIWRHDPFALSDGRRTPPRPPIEAIEQLSPDFETSPRALDYPSHHWNGYDGNTHSLNGLGVSYDSTNDIRHEFDRPREIHINENGTAHLWNARPITNSYHTGRSHYSRSNTPRPHTRDGAPVKKSRAKAHTRSGSTIDDLASAAIATSPSLMNGSAFSHTSRPTTSYVYDQYYSNSERPAKRVKSEMIPQTEWPPKEGRTPSYAESATERNEQAELLLSLSRSVVDFKRGYGSPPNQQAALFSPPQPTPKITRTVPPASPTVINNLPNGHLESPSRLPRIQPISEEIRKSPEAPPFEPLEDDLKDDLVEDSTEMEPKPDLATQEQGDTTDRMEDVELEGTPGQRHPNPTGDPANEDTQAPPTKEGKKQRRIQVQAVVCARCQRLQREIRTVGDEDMDPWISCNACEKWFHAACVGFKDRRETQTVDKFICKECEPTKGVTTFVKRNPTRPRTDIDYAKLNEGLVKSSVETSMHHYIQPIKDGKFNFRPENFARIAPELVTAEYFERAGGMKRPIVIPADLNPRFGAAVKIVESPTRYEEAEDKTRPEFNVIDEPPESDSGIVQEDAVETDQDRLDMVMPRGLTVRKVSELVGPDEPVQVIDVKSQSSDSHWTLQKWADYYESTGDKPIRNVISLEVSLHALGRLIRRPSYVRDVDLQDLVWPETVNKLKSVQFYCLMSVAESFTDFHIDFGGSSVYYHILKGTKTFFFIPPEDKNLKKYQDWCNSSNQNETFLGDLTGDCCRVDLHEGDTMLIPAGWIHAVWTPEDSLVIGGNFLTRMDYAMQIRVAEIEKNTGVGLSFRYPFFQKVMWFTLLKYLDEEPVPQSVMDDFISDESYVYLRADGVWVDEYDDGSAEPGDPEFNARLYSKPEIEGLPALRDYLLRTARIANDLPVVPPVSKDQARKVKASIPKGHGDPMALVRMFAIWCAWKTGCVTAPEWVHDDPETLASLIEKREPVKKPETFRIPPERVSSRKTSQFPIEIPGLDSETTTNPGKPPAWFDGESDDGNRHLSNSKGSGLGPKRVACSPCRKRRIKCRHKEEPETQPESSRSQPLANTTVETPRAATDPSVSSMDGIGSPEQHFPDLNGAVPLDLAQAAMASLNYQSNDTFVENGLTTPNSGKKGRSKACEECRKSKRRCVHDEYGRVDPAKAAEPSKPRGSANAKRSMRTSDEYSQTSKRSKDMSFDNVANSQRGFDSLIDPALIGEAQPPRDRTLADIDHLMAPALDAMQSSMQAMRQHDDIVAPTDFPRGPALNGAEDSMPIDPALEQATFDQAPPETVVKSEQNTVEFNQSTHLGAETAPANLNDASARALETSPTVVNGVNLRTSIESTGDNTDHSFYTPLSASRQSSRQPKMVDRYVPEDTRVSPKTIKIDRRGSSSGSSGPTPAFGDIKSRRSSSNTSGTTHQIAAGQLNDKIGSRASSARPGSRGSAMGESDLDPDEAFARALQAQEHGLRRRASGKL